ncbi:MAG TPA: hypothetical protein VMB26_11325 [Candidatus Binataceae bacterium]|nr:hypothetical protein [Candidatus Binataceae bacterium]
MKPQAGLWRLAIVLIVLQLAAASLSVGSACAQSASAMTIVPALPARQPDGSIEMPIPFGVDNPGAVGESTRQVSTAKNLIDHGGPILSSSNIYIIYWGNPSEFPSDLDQGLSTFYEGWGNSSYSNILTQYLRGAPPPTDTLVGSASDTTTAPPSRSPKLKRIVHEACKFTGGTVDPNGIYVVTTSQPLPNATFCAWHNHGMCNGSPIVVVFLPKTSGLCQIVPTNQNNYSNTTQSMVNYAAHELAESMTDPFINAWYDSHGREVADKCYTKFGPPVTLSNGSVWEVQEYWSNAVGKCLQTLALP